MAIKHTGNTTFFSKSNKIGSTKWRIEHPPQLPRGYVLDMAFMPSLPFRWYAIGLVFLGGVYAFRVYGYGSDPEASLDAVDVQAVIASPPVLNVPLNVTDEATALERFERVVSNVMHGLLAPLPAVQFLWARFATTDGTDAYRS